MWNPRMGGEKPFLFYGGSSDSGSPPRGRGKGNSKADGRCAMGITPAWAGKSVSSEIRTFSRQDHPRVGGEKDTMPNFWAAASGSPPHGRGKVLQKLRQLSLVGIAPAWAGKSRYRCRCWSGGQDHPRMGGEKSPGRALRCCIRGSPPRGRGKETRPLLCRFSSGITPAWAGKSRPVSPPHRPHRDHPRMGGEKRQALSAAHGSAGSPPRGRVWGDRIFEKCGIRRDEGGDDGKTLEMRGKRRLSARDGGANYQQS